MHGSTTVQVATAVEATGVTAIAAVEEMVALIECPLMYADNFDKRGTAA